VEGISSACFYSQRHKTCHSIQSLHPTIYLQDLSAVVLVRNIILLCLMFNWHSKPMEAHTFGNYHSWMFTKFPKILWNHKYSYYFCNGCNHHHHQHRCCKVIFPCYILKICWHSSQLAKLVNNNKQVAPAPVLWLGELNINNKGNDMMRYEYYGIWKFFPYSKAQTRLIYVW